MKDWHEQMFFLQHVVCALLCLNVFLCLALIGLMLFVPQENVVVPLLFVKYVFFLCTGVVLDSRSLATSLGTPVQANVIQYKSPAIKLFA